MAFYGDQRLGSAAAAATLDGFRGNAKGAKTVVETAAKSGLDRESDRVELDRGQDFLVGA